MQKNVYWVAFIFLFAIVTLSYIAITGYKFYNFKSLSQTTDAELDKWGVKKIGDDRYALEAHYHFFIHGQQYFNQDIVTWPTYRNVASAKAHIPSEKTTTVYYSPSQPNKNRLQNPLPVRNLVYTVLLMATFVYLLIVHRIATRTA